MSTKRHSLTTRQSLRARSTLEMAVAARILLAKMPVEPLDDEPWSGEAAHVQHGKEFRWKRQDAKDIALRSSFQTAPRQSAQRLWSGIWVKWGDVLLP